MEEGLLLKERLISRATWDCSRSSFEEVKKLCYIAVPMVAVNLSLSLLHVISLTMVGHLGELSLSSTALAISICSVTGFSFLILVLKLKVILMIYAILVKFSTITISFHIIFSWVMVYKSGLNHVGAALAIGASIWLNLSILSLYIKYSSSFAKTRAPISLEIFQGIKDFFRFAVPSAVMICLEWWSYELLVLLSGLVPNPQLETSVLSVCLNTMITLYAIPNALSVAVSTRVSNELGAGNPRGAQLSVFGLMFLAATEIIILVTALFASRHVFGYIFSSDKEVVDYVKNMAPLLGISLFMDGIKGTLPGVARGCGWQHLGAIVNLASFYVFGIPIAVILCFVFKLRGKGLWIGILSGGTMQSLLYSIITYCTNWENQAIKARERLFKEKHWHDDVLE
ncbi:hypothetical protein M9H77_08228 [Catharanthus roseus]|uniref:Uncharacterized protein n=1 Tax=Catharanthus roseus TaxID=4058 RepID=A0ACC0BXK9_CATRO|nr:hypothetical protein M9H77_08228 [Catharanthus roseus]